MARPAALRRSAAVSALATGLFFGGPAAAGGLLLYEFGTAERGLAAAGYAARAQDASTAFTHPAGMTRLDSPQAPARHGAHEAVRVSRPLLAGLESRPG